MDDRTLTEPARRRRQRTRKRRPIEGADAICELLLAMVVGGSALAIGTVHIAALYVVSALSLVGGVIGATAFRRVPKPAIVLGGLALFSALQAVPLPASWVSHASPVSAQIWSRTLEPFGVHALGYFPVSMDAGASLTEALKWLTYAGVYVMAARVRLRRGSAWHATVLFSSATLVTLITLVHGVADLRVLYGLYEPNFAIGRWNVGPLLNSNNLAGYAILGLFAGIGLLLSHRSILPRVLLYIGAAVILTALFLSGSRAGVLSAILGGIVTLIWLTQVQRFRLSVARLALGATPFLLALFLAIGFGTTKNWSQLASVDAKRKIAVWVWSLPMIHDHAWFGVGRGAFETALPPYRQAFDYDWTAAFSHAENFVVQWVAEWGIPVGLSAALLISGYIFREWIASRGDRLRFMLLTGLGALFVQNLADLGLEVPAVAIAAVVALAAGETSAQRHAVGHAPRLGLRALAAAAPAAIIWVAAAVWSRSPVESERRDLSQSYRALPVKNIEERRLFREDLRDAMLRHPSESFFPLLGSLVAFRARDQNPLPWMSRALELAPTNGHVHLVLAQFLGAHHATDQAMLHLRLATEYDRTLVGIASSLAVRWAPSLEVLLLAVPDGPAGDVLLPELCTQERQLELQVGCFRHAVARVSDSVTLRGQFADSLLLALRSGQPPCAGPAASDSCAQEIDGTARSMAKLDPKSWRPGYIMAKLLTARGDSSRAAELLARVCPAGTEGNECARDAVTTALKGGTDKAILAAANSYAARSCDSNDSCAEALDWLGRTLDSGGKLAFAIEFYSKAAENDDSAVRWLKVADRAMMAHLYGVARTALQHADYSPDATPNSRAHSELLMRRVARGLGANAGPL
jgi:O-antigen ligase